MLVAQTDVLHYLWKSILSGPLLRNLFRCRKNVERMQLENMQQTHPKDFTVLFVWFSQSL